MTTLTCDFIPSPTCRVNHRPSIIKSLLIILILSLLTNNYLSPVVNSSTTPSTDEAIEKSQVNSISAYQSLQDAVSKEEPQLVQTTMVNLATIPADDAPQALAESTDIAATNAVVSAQAKMNPLAPSVLDPQDWQNWPIIPVLNERMMTVYKEGLAMGNNPQAFTKIGDGEISALWFLTDFDLGPQYYDLGPYAELLPAIEYFAGSFAHSSQAARRGFNTTRILDPSLANPNFCNPDESPLACELRLYQPSFALISLGTNQVWAPEVLGPELRQIIEILLADKVIPVLSTKADNLEGDYRINTIIAELATEYEVPLWNFWRAVQPLPEHGLQEDFEHLTYAPNDFSDPEVMQYAWPVRNLTALQVLSALMEKVR